MRSFIFSLLFLFISPVAYALSLDDLSNKDAAAGLENTLDGLFVMMAEEEKAIRADPVGQTSKLLSKVFGAVGK